jgi:hypothetical protein
VGAGRILSAILARIESGDRLSPSNEKTVAEYIASLTTEQAGVIRKIRALIRKSLPKGYQESMNWGIISYEIPLSRYADTHNRQPLAYLALGANKNYFSLHLMGCYGNPALMKKFESAYRKSGKRLDMGKACLRFKKIEDLPLDVIAHTIASVSVDNFIAEYERIRNSLRK